MPADGWELELTLEDGRSEIHVLAGMALIERASDHGDWYREVVGLFPCPEGGGFCTVYDCSGIVDISYRLRGSGAMANGSPGGMRTLPTADDCS